MGHFYMRKQKLTQMENYLFKINYIFACNWLNKKTLNMMSQKRLTLRLPYRDATKNISHTQKWGHMYLKKFYLWHAMIKRGTDMPTYCSLCLFLS